MTAYKARFSAAIQKLDGPDLILALQYLDRCAYLLADLDESGTTTKKAARLKRLQGKRKTAAAESCLKKAVHQMRGAGPLRRTTAAPATQTIRAPAVPVLQRQPLMQTNFWVFDLGVTVADRNIILNNEWLNDRIMDAAQRIVNGKMGKQGIQTNLLRQTQFAAEYEDCIQFHHDGADHWVLSRSDYRNKNVFVYDSLNRGCVSVERISAQMQQLYSPLMENGVLRVTNVLVDKQPNGLDCGVYAIANAMELVTGNEPRRAKYINSQMRQCLIQILERKVAFRFPQALTMVDIL